MAVPIYKQPPGDERRQALLAIWRRGLHNIVVASGECFCQKGQPEKCILLHQNERLAEMQKDVNFSFENFCKAIEAVIAAAKEYQSPTEKEIEDGKKIVAGIKLVKMYRAVVAYMSCDETNERRQAVAVVWQDFVHKSALALGSCGCQLGQSAECWGQMDMKMIKEKAAGRGQGFETFFDEVKKAAKFEEARLLRADPNLLKKG